MTRALSPAGWPVRVRLAAATGAGAVTVLGFAPVHAFPLPWLAAGLLYLLCVGEPRPRTAALHGFAFGLGLFLAGVGWVYVALNRYGAMPFWLAIPVTFVFCAYLALFPALACGLATRTPAGLRWATFPAAWALSEWLRGWLFTGFPWLSLGYSQVPHGPFGALAPMVGVFGVSFVTILAGTLLACAFQKRLRLAVTGGIALAAAVGGAALPRWTHPVGEPLAVTLVQGNVAQEMKFREDRLIRTLVGYGDSVARSRTRLVILPETALPVFLHDLPEEYLDRLQDHMRSLGGDVIVGLFENDPPGSRRVFNAVRSFGASPGQSYRKSHLVPFGEFIPLEPVLGPVIRDWLHIPLGEQSRGDKEQVPLAVAGQRVAMNICYEDVFGEEIIRQLPGATLLANVTNDAWYGRSWAAVQHMQISQMRARETGRWMLRATNTGVTAVIDEAGRVRERLEEFTAGELVAEVQGRAGATPYVVTGNAPVLIASLAVMIGARLSRRARRE